MRKTVYFVLLILFLSSTFCSDNNSPVVIHATGDFTLLTYNVAGLPQGISPSNPEKNIPLISPLLNNFDIVVVQEDFAFHEALKEKVLHPFQSVPQSNRPGVLFGDGLNRFSKFSFKTLLRQTWFNCSNNNGNDCYAAKGFSVAETTIAPGIVIDIYNLHLDAGGSEQDFAARTAQIEQLLQTLVNRSSDRAVIIAGDINLNPESRPQDTGPFQRLLEVASLTDACSALNCPMELVDKVLFRSSSSVSLQAISWSVDEKFVNEHGQSLSDHRAVTVKIKWELQ